MCSYHPQLIQTLAKWSSKIQAVAPSVLLPSNKGTFSKGKQQPKSAVQLVDEALLDHSKLLSRTQLRRTPGTRIGNAPAESNEVKEDPELFDDSDFYQKMLRDIIDSRTGGKESSQDWLAIQKQKKAKKEVDTKASKGRKLRYVGGFICSTICSDLHLRTDIMCMKRYRTLWSLYLWLGPGTMNRLTNSSRRYWGRDSRAPRLTIVWKWKK